jgi:hypothetical protein
VSLGRTDRGRIPPKISPEMGYRAPRLIIKGELEFVPHRVKVQLGLRRLGGSGVSGKSSGLSGEKLFEVRLRGIIQDSQSVANYGKIFFTHRALMVVVETDVSAFVTLQRAPPRMPFDFKHLVVNYHEILDESRRAR